MNIFWFIPTHGEGRYLGTTVGARPATFDYFLQVARAVDHLGYHGALLPTGKGCEDAWVVASALAAQTTRMKLLVALRPGLMSPGVAARMAATFDRITNGRLLINIVTGGDPTEMAADGVHLTHDERYEVTDEFLTVWRALSRGEKVTFRGKYLDIRDGRLLFPSVQTPHVPLYFGGSSDAGIRVGAKHADVYLTWGELPAVVAQKVARVRELAAAENRTVRFGIRLHVIVRETDAEARHDAQQLIQHVADDVVAEAQKALAKYDSEGQRRMREVHDSGDRASLWVRPDLWAGVGLVRGGAGTAMVGDPHAVASLMREYVDAGIDTFILSGYPHLEEAYRFAELVFPLISPCRTEAEPPQVSKAILGEVVANGAHPLPTALGR